jgi:uncharacterized protein (TIGR03083 family)
MVRLSDEEATVDQERSWELIAAERRALADLLDGLTPEQWESPSLCAGWRVRDVAAHVALTPQHPSIGGMIAGAIRARGNFDRLNHDYAVDHAARPPEQLVAELREFADSRRRPAITTVPNLLFDVPVHVQDVAIALGLEHTMPLDAARAGVERVWRMGWPFHARRRLRGMRLVATDSDWETGEGEEVRGPTAALLLLLTGRDTAAAPHLAGLRPS